MLVIVHRQLAAASRRSGLLAVMMAATVLSGPQIYILGSASIYHEPILWSAAMAAAFNLVIVRTAFGAQSLCSRDLVVLAALAGLAIITRPTVGVALITTRVEFKPVVTTMAIVAPTSAVTGTAIGVSASAIGGATTKP